MLFRLLMAGLAMAGGLIAQSDWTAPMVPHRIADNFHYVGSKDLASYLVTSPQGHILINSSLAASVPLIQASVEKLGFRFTDIKILVVSHAHWDHCAGSAEILKRSGAKYMVMDADVAQIEAGGKGDFQYGESAETLYTAAKVDRVLHDGDEVKLGPIVLKALLTAGHTRGCTTWTLKVKDGGKTYDAVIVGSPNVNPGYKLVGNAAYPKIASDYEHTFKVLKALPCDIFLGAHGLYYGMQDKFKRLTKTGGNPFVDPAGYRAYVADREKAFRAELEKQKAR